MIEIKEAQMAALFIEKQLKEIDETRCVDGRPAKDSRQGPQMLGGIIHPILLSTTYENTQFDAQTVTNKTLKLLKLGVPIGVHRGHGANHEKSGCGLADQLDQIIMTAQKNIDEINRRVSQVFQANHSAISTLGLPSLETMIKESNARIMDFDPEKIKIKGPELINLMEEKGAKVETVEGEHNESEAFVNVNPSVTLDTIALNNLGDQAFNLDLNAPVKISSKLSVPQIYAIPASLQLYIATEMVLVEQKGKPALPVKIHA